MTTRYRYLRCTYGFAVSSSAQSRSHPDAPQTRRGVWRKQQSGVHVIRSPAGWAAGTTSDGSSLDMRLGLGRGSPTEPLKMPVVALGLADQPLSISGGLSPGRARRVQAGSVRCCPEVAGAFVEALAGVQPT